MAALSRIANSSYRDVEVLPGDTVIFSSSPIPGNERGVSRIIDNLFLLGAKVIYGSGSSTGMHVSGHAYQEELRLMLTLMKPKYFVPIHGEYRMLHHHCQLAESIGIDPQNMFILKNGDVLDLKDGQASQTRTIPAGNIYIDGLGIGSTGNIILRDRQKLSADGMLIIVIGISKTEGRIVTGPDTITRGFIYVRESEELLKEINQIAAKTVNSLLIQNHHQWNVLKKEVKEKLGHYLFKETKKRPMILPIIIEV